MNQAGERFVDLHVHSTASDGAYSPGRVMELAAIRGLAAVGLTDHDTIAGLGEAEEASRRLGIELVPGIEISAGYRGRSIHILGYFFDGRAEELGAFLETVAARRRARNVAIMDRLALLGLRLESGQIAGPASVASLGRSHIAAALIRCGAASSRQDAFRRFLGEGGSAYVEHDAVAPERAVAAIRAAGGVASVAHPSRIRYDSPLELETLIRRLRDAGLGAIEVEHPDHTNEQRGFYMGLAMKLGLGLTGGSDFHAIPRRADHGIGFNGRRIPMTWLEAIRGRAMRDH